MIVWHGCGVVMEPGHGCCGLRGPGLAEKV